MEQLYGVYHQDDCVGQVQIQKEGLYYCVSCLAEAPGKSMYRLIARGESFYHDFGLCIPKENGIGILTRVPVKLFTEDAVKFELKDYKEKGNTAFIPVSTEKAFVYLDRLEQAHLEYREGTIGICFRD